MTAKSAILEPGPVQLVEAVNLFDYLRRPPSPWPATWRTTSRAMAEASREARGASIDGSARGSSTLQPVDRSFADLICPREERRRNGWSGVGGSYHRRATGRRDWPKALTSRGSGVWRAPCSRSGGSSITPQERSSHHHRRESRQNSPSRHLVGCRGRPHVSRPVLSGPGLRQPPDVAGQHAQ